jgi:hypothetical protein
MGYNDIPESYPPVIVGRVKDEYFYEATTKQHLQTRRAGLWT